MRIELNGEATETEATTLAAFVVAAEFDPEIVATALNGEFVPRGERVDTPIAEGDRIEVFSPRQGG
ncbi:sulfur carrier protein ThiS [Methylobrevis pamukkalensis]|uniref:Sulfur carrier protein ThiS n=1 Tax=Methylobrevis pamukkalensis TaxID=1439726 RepID=A0A1E3H524_9HYPH|nr:sulfur carrier protein ThiS [Methylobrevis pamukkalensis]ODN71433.1 sulfur carrier protein ThiS [Methylobrevis pamukkalensis]